LNASSGIKKLGMAAISDPIKAIIKIIYFTLLPVVL